MAHDPVSVRKCETITLNQLNLELTFSSLFPSQNFMHASREEMRTSASQLYAIVANSTDTAKLVGLIKDLTKNTKQQVSQRFNLFYFI